MTDKREDNATPIIIDPRLLQGYYNHDDEISLADLWLTLVEQKRVFFTVFITLILLALLYVLITPKRYEYKTVITIGTQAQAQAQAQAQLIESPASVKARLDNAIIPKVLMQQSQHADPLDISVTVPKNTLSVLLASKGTQDQEHAIRDFHNQLIQILHDAHQRKTAPLLTYFQEELSSTQTLLDNLHAQKKQPTKEQNDLTMQIINLENLLHELKLNLALFSQTRSDMGTVRSAKPINKSSKLILAVTVVLGMFAGIFAALFAGFIANIKNKKRT